MHLSVVGGYYDEFCAEPYWHERFGSGGRASAAISGRKASIEFVTYAPVSWNASLDNLANTFGFDVKVNPSPIGVAYKYLHWLKCTGVSPNRSAFDNIPAIEIKDRERALCFGLYERQAKVIAKQVVYDPQNEMDAKWFSENGSRAERMAIVCNYLEGVTLTKEREPTKIVSSLLQTADVVVLKSGWSGLIVANKSSHKVIPAIPTRRVHKMGSGDIFSAEFAYHWMIAGLDPFEAAMEANRRVAYYSDNGGTLPIPSEISVEQTSTPISANSKKIYDFYLAGPFFSANQLGLIEELLTQLRQAGVKVFSPYHDVGLADTVDVAKKDLKGLQESQFVFACLDGYDPGTVFEVGYACALGIPVLVYSPTLKKPHITMFAGSDCEIATDFTTALYRAVWWAKNK